jgi:hypothetical protein
MSDEEFSTRLEIRLSKHLPIDDHHREKLWQIVAEIRGMEREEKSREMMMQQRNNIHPVCYY